MHICIESPPFIHITTGYCHSITLDRNLHITILVKFTLTMTPLEHEYAVKFEILLRAWKDDMWDSGFPVINKNLSSIPPVPLPAG